MNHSSHRGPLERRREAWTEPSGVEKNRTPFARREGDFARLKLEHWMELADTALAGDHLQGELEDDQPPRG